MTEKQKMLNGQMYYPGDQELTKDRESCKALCRIYNGSAFASYEERASLLNKILGRAGSDIYIEQPFYCDYGYNIETGINFYANHNLVILDCAKVTIGDNVMIGPNCGIYTAEHPLDYKTRNTLLEYAKEIQIGDNVWIGGNVTILSGVKIGNGCVIGAGSVVTKDIPDNALVAGNPAKILKIIEQN